VLLAHARSSPETVARRSFRVRETRVVEFSRRSCIERILMTAREPPFGSDTVTTFPFSTARESTFQPGGLYRAKVLSPAVYNSIFSGPFPCAGMASEERRGRARTTAIRMEGILGDIVPLRASPSLSGD